MTTTLAPMSISELPPARQAALAPESTTGPRARSKAEPKAEPKAKSLWYYLRVAISASLLILVLALAAAVIVVPAVTHSIPLTVLTSSMEPSLPPGTLVIVQPVEPADIRIGDAVTYQIRSGEPEVITHRVIAITQGVDGSLAFTLQGDNNASPDADPVQEVQVQGRVWYSVPYLGWVNSTVNGENRSWIIPIAAGVLLCYAVWMVISGIVGSRRKAREAAARPAGRHVA
jgi:signal peptidase